MLQQHANRAVVLQVQPQPCRLPAQITFTRSAERALELLRRGLLERRLGSERRNLRVLLARTPRIVRVNLIDPRAQRRADRSRALGDDFLADAFQVMVDAL